MRRGLRQTIEAHLGSRDMARVLYGAVVGLAVVLALQDHPPHPGATAGIILATALAIGLAELYSETLSAEARGRRRIERAQLRTMAGEAVAVVVGAGFPAIFFVAEAAGVVDEHVAFVLARWSGAVLIFGYGFLAARLAGLGIARSGVHSFAVCALGVALIEVKSVLH
jgi:hypothetical protein